MHHVEQIQDITKEALEVLSQEFEQGLEMRLYTRHEHGNRPVRGYRDDNGKVVYELGGAIYTTWGSLRAAIYGREDVSISFDRYFRIGRHRLPGRSGGSSNLLTLLDGGDGLTRRTTIAVHRGVQTQRSTGITYSSKGLSTFPEARYIRESRVTGDSLKTLDPEIEAFVEAMRADCRPYEEFIPATPERGEEFIRAFSLELDRVEGLVGIELSAWSNRKGSRTKADEVRRLLWKGFARKMLSQGYDPDDVLQEVYRGLLVRNGGKCPWDARKSTFGHYVHLVCQCVTTNYHRKQARSVMKNALSLELPNSEGEEIRDGWFGSSEIWSGSDVGDRMALEALVEYIEGIEDETPEGKLGRAILPLVASGHQRSEIVQETGERASMVSRALAWIRRQAAGWASSGGLREHVPPRYQVA